MQRLGASMARTVRLMAIAVLALMQSLFGILRAFEWFRMGIDLSGRGVILLPIIGSIAYTWGKLALVLALLYILFALGALFGQRWAWGRRRCPYLSVVLLTIALTTLAVGAYAQDLESRGYVNTPVGLNFL